MAKRLAVFHPEFRQDLQFWVKNDRKTALRVLDLVEKRFFAIPSPESASPSR